MAFSTLTVSIDKKPMFQKFNELIKNRFDTIFNI